MPRQCRARLMLPAADGFAQVVFTCTDDRHEGGGDHVERGRLRRKDGTSQEYVIRWNNPVTEREAWREVKGRGPLEVDDGD